MADMKVVAVLIVTVVIMVVITLGVATGAGTTVIIAATVTGLVFPM